MLIKIKYIKNRNPCGREYTYQSQIMVEIGDMVELPGGGIGIVTEINVSEESVKGFADKIKKIIGLKKINESEER